MSSFWCAIEDAGRAGAARCDSKCPTCEAWVPERNEDRPLTTLETEPSGLYYDYADPQPEQVELVDIARALSEACRFSGFVKFTYSVAEHAVFVHNTVVEWGHPELALAALHHDSHEAYLGDWPTPLKRAVGATELSRLQEACDCAIGEKLGIDPELFDHPIVKRADLDALFREAATLKSSRGVGLHWGRTAPAEQLPPEAGLSPGQAEVLFMMTHLSHNDDE